MKNRIKNSIIVFVLICISVALFSQKQIPQDQHYHDFSGDLTILGIPNFWNVVSNLPFIVLGFYGLVKFIDVKKNQTLNTIHIFFFIGVLLIGLGSGYYHLHPNNQTLVWDRLPMTIAFMSFVAILIYHFISSKMADILLLPLIALGISSVAHWQYTEEHNCSDLRFYALVQFLPIVFCLLVVLFYGRYRKDSGYYISMLFCYAIAKWFEMNDDLVFKLNGHIGGHCFKHLFAAMGIAAYPILMLKQSSKAIAMVYFKQENRSVKV